MAELMQIRKFEPRDRADVRRISCQTAFLGMSVHDFIGDEEIVADALTFYYTDYEPESCFVATSNSKVVGYIIGSTDVIGAQRKSNQISLMLVKKAFQKGVFLKKNIWIFLGRVLWSAIKGEFLAPDFSRQYPASLHINIDKDFRGQRVGAQLIEYYLGYLKSRHIKGVHFGTISERAKNFFLRNGFDILLEGKRSYLSFYTLDPVKYYIFGKTITLQ